MHLLLLLASGCSRPCGTVLHTDSPHVIELSWTGPGAEVAYIVGDTERRVRGDGAVSLIGLPPLTDIPYTLLDDDGDAVCTGSTESWNLPAGLPSLSVTTTGTTSSEQLLAGTTIGEQPSVFVIDREGRWLWHQELAEDRMAVDVHAVDDQLLYNRFDATFSEDIGALLQANAAGIVTDERRLEGGHHTFAVLPDGTIAFPSVDVRDGYDVQREETIQIVGDRLLELAPDGTVREVFNIWDYEEPKRHEQWDSDFYPWGADWSHANAVHYSVERDSYLFSLGHLDTVYEIDRTTGDVIARINADDWTIDGTIFRKPHDPNWTAAGTLLMLAWKTRAIAIEYVVDVENQRLEEVWSDFYDREGVAMLGQARRLENGNTFINYGGSGVMREVTPAGEVVWELSTPLGTWLGNAQWVDGVFDQ